MQRFTGIYTLSCLQVISLYDPKLQLKHVNEELNQYCPIGSHSSHQVAPAELEAILLTHPSVADVGVTGIPHPKHGEVPRAYVVLKPNKTQTTADELKAFVAGEMSYL